MLTVVKRDKRVQLVNEAGATVYAAPNFVRVPDRTAFARLADRINETGDYIGSVMEFEGKFSKRLAAGRP